MYVLFNAAMVPDQIHACLLFTFLVTILKNSEFEHEQQYIYKSLVEGVSFLPDAFPLTFEVLIPKMQQVSYFITYNSTFHDEGLNY